jgi:hypothetical protein
VASPAPTQEAARRRRSAATARVSSSAVDASPAADWSGEVAAEAAVAVVVALVSDSAMAVARERAPCRARNCSTAGCGLCSSAAELTSAYELIRATQR